MSLVAQYGVSKDQGEAISSHPNCKDQVFSHEGLYSMNLKCFFISIREFRF